jgi:hypothetical protein
MLILEAFADELDKIAKKKSPDTISGLFSFLRSKGHKVSTSPLNKVAYSTKGHPKYKDFKKNRVPLTPDERAEVMKRKAVWNFHFGKDGKRQKTPAVSKAIIDGKTWFETHTHRAINYAPSLRGAISRYHKFIKSTA